MGWLMIKTSPTYYPAKKDIISIYRFLKYVYNFVVYVALLCFPVILEQPHNWTFRVPTPFLGTFSIQNAIKSWISMSI